MQSRKRKMAAALAALMAAGMAGCGGASAGETVSAPASQPEAESTVSAEAQPSSEPSAEAETPTLIAEQVLEGETGSIHYSYYLPAGYSEEESYPLVMTMPGYDMMWFGEDSSGSNLNWGGFTCWNGLDEKMIVVSAQLTDWGETSARQANELTEYFIENFPGLRGRVFGRRGDNVPGGVDAAGPLRRLSPRRVPVGRGIRPGGGKRRRGLYLYGRGGRVLRLRPGAGGL